MIRTIEYSDTDLSPRTIIEFESSSQDPDDELEALFERVLGKCDPILTAIAISRRYRKARSSERYAQAPPHFVAKAIEAACAYHREFYRDPLSGKQYARLHNAFADSTPSYQKYALDEGDFDGWGFAAFQEQMRLQYETSPLDIFRAAHIFLDSTTVVPFDTGFTNHFGLSLSEWAYICMSFWASAERSPDLAGETLASESHGAITTEQVKQFLKLTALDVASLGRQYRERRAAIRKPYLRRLIPSVFLDYPILIHDELRVVVPFSNLLAHSLFHTPADVRSELSESAAQSFDDSFELYVQDWLSRLPRLQALHTEDEYVEGGRRADFWCEFPDCDLFVEVKSAARPPTLPITSSLVSSGFVGALATGVAQVGISAKHVSNRGSDRTIYGIVVCRGEPPFPNSDRFFSEVLTPRLREIAPSCDLNALDARPQILPIDAFELFCSYLIANDSSPLDLFQLRANSEYLVYGEWSPFIRRIHDNAIPFVPEHVQERTSRFLDDLRSVLEVPK